MHPINFLLRPFHMHLRRNTGLPAAFLPQYKSDLARMKQNSRGFEVFPEGYYEVGEHPEPWGSAECRFAAKHIARVHPTEILDIGSYRLFILGLLGDYKVTTIDVRRREQATANETVVVSDAKQLALPDKSFDTVTALCAIEHFGLGRYGDEYDETGDLKAVREFIRVLKPGGRLVFSIPFTRGHAAIAFNAHRIYTQQMVRDFCAGLTPEGEEYYSIELARPCSFEEVTSAPTKWDIYLGCWRKGA